MNSEDACSERRITGRGSGVVTVIPYGSGDVRVDGVDTAWAGVFRGDDPGRRPPDALFPEVRSVGILKQRGEDDGR